MNERKKRLDTLVSKLEKLVSETNEKICWLGECDNELYGALLHIQRAFDRIRNVPEDKKLEYDKVREVCLSWKSHVDKIEHDYATAAKVEVQCGAAGTSLGVGVATLGPWAAMGIATSFGVASTGTAISALSGAAATNAAVAWLGGGAIAAGGGGMAAGNAFLALAGPVGWGIAAVSFVASGLFFLKTISDKHKLEDVFILIAIRDTNSYYQALIEMLERMSRIKDETEKLNDAVRDIDSFGTDYNRMTEAQQYALGSYINLMLASTQLLVNPIMGLQPKVSFDDVWKYVRSDDYVYAGYNYYANKEIIVYLANLLYMIDMDRDAGSLLMKSFRNNKDFLKKMNLSGDVFDMDLYDFVHSFLQYK